MSELTPMLCGQLVVMLSFAALGNTESPRLQNGALVVLVIGAIVFIAGFCFFLQSCVGK